MRSTMAETQLSNYGTDLYSRLEEETGLGTGFKTLGGVYLARTKERMTLYKRNLAKCQAYDIKAELISPQRCQELWPVELNLDDIQGGLWVPEEGVANPSDICQSLARGAIMNGVRIYEKVQLQSVTTDGQYVDGVKTDKGDIKCDIFINCAGQWAREVGQKSSPAVSVPIHACEHFYIVTKTVEGVHSTLPNMRDPDGHIYFREWSGGLMAGGFEPVSKPCFHESVPDKFEFQLLPEDWDHFEVLMEQMLHRVPALHNAEIRQLVNGPESFTPDGQYILGEAPEVRNYFVAAGMCSSGIASAAGVGKALSEWITEGHPTMDLWPVDIRRFGNHFNNKQFLRDRVRETLGWHYVMRYPYSEKQTARGVKCSPLYAQLDSAGAVWGERMGWERPRWFQLDEEGKTELQVVPSTNAFGKPAFFRNVQVEYAACHNSVALVDMTSVGLFEISQFMQTLCARDVGVPIGHIVQTALLNKRGGYELECTVARTAENRYIIMVPTAHTVLAQNWISRHIPNRSSITLRDIQSGFVVLGVLGPMSAELLQGFTTTDLTSDYPIDTFKELSLGFASDVKAFKRTNVGDLEQGWQLIIPTEYASGLYSQLTKAGKAMDIRNVGCYAVDALRVEKGYPRLGIELTPFVNPFQAGLESRICMFKNEEFIGRSALLSLQDQPITKRLLFMAMEEHDDTNIPWGGEPILRNGEIVGTTSSASFSFTLNAPVCMGYVSNAGHPVSDEYIRDGKFEIDVAGQRYPLRAAIHKFTEQPTGKFFTKVFV
ncbi:predicted protein [Nematostella vectensis]|uniref:Uncharacterized protein n=1 Tax=Nematostella vectensis TaxID=45351 RepID=A7S3V0_NEMVE|nr:predicted protein [Nematostella vectensis]|eukprot:XP_001633663.1 predicted protein [Nematostella vectensis]